jgi:hypothetical protein
MKQIYHYNKQIERYAQNQIKNIELDFAINLQMHHYI